MRQILANLAKEINIKLPHLCATVEDMSYTLERRTPGRMYVNARWTRRGKGVRVVDQKEPWKTVYELNMACWYRRVSDGYRWLEEQLRTRSEKSA